MLTSVTRQVWRRVFVLVSLFGSMFLFGICLFVYRRDHFPYYINLGTSVPRFPQFHHLELRVSFLFTVPYTSLTLPIALVVLT